MLRGRIYRDIGAFLVAMLVLVGCATVFSSGREILPQERASGRLYTYWVQSHHRTAAGDTMSVECVANPWGGLSCDWDHPFVIIDTIG